MCMSLRNLSKFIHLQSISQSRFSGINTNSDQSLNHAGLLVNGGMHLCLHMCKVRVPLQRSIPVRVPSRGGSSGSEARHLVTMRGVVTTTLMVTRVATPIPSVPLGLLRVSLWCSHGLLCCLHTSLPVSARWSCEARHGLSKSFPQPMVWRMVGSSSSNPLK
jgi:hypothetical protein